MSARKGIITPMAKSLAKPAPTTAGGGANLNKAGHVSSYRVDDRIEKNSKVLAPMQEIIRKKAD